MKRLIYKPLRKGARLLRRAHSAGKESVQKSFDRWKLSKMPIFNEMLSGISRGVEPASEALLPYITHEEREERLWCSLQLAKAFFDNGNYAQAKVFIQRVWIASANDEKYLSLFVSIHAACDDVDAIRAAHKALGVKKANANRVVQALDHFNAWQNAYMVHRLEDDYSYDLEILDQIANMARPHAFPMRKSRKHGKGKLRVAYLMFGMTHVNSVIVKISLLFAKYHDPSQFEVTFYVPEQTSVVMSYPEAVRNIREIEGCGWNVVLAPDAISEETSLIGLARSIYEAHADVLVTAAGLADLKHYFITALQPAPAVIGLCQGPPPQFIAPSFNWSVSWFSILVPDCPTGCSVVNLRLDPPVRKYTREEAKLSFGISGELKVVMSCGRAAKLQDSQFLNALVELAILNPEIFIVLVGLDELPLALREKVTPDISGRIKTLGWERDFIRVLSMADIVIDTFPSGGGVVVKDAMALGTPVVSFKHDYLKTFSQKECSSAEEVIGIPELIVERGDFAALNPLVRRLITDQEYYENLAELCKERIAATSGNPQIMVKECEEIYSGVVRRLQSGGNFLKRGRLE